MNPRHAGALALVGWYLMLLPKSDDPPVIYIPYFRPYRGPRR